MKITGRSHDLLFQDFTLRDVSGYSFYVYDPAKVFAGTKESTFLGCVRPSLLTPGGQEYDGQEHARNPGMCGYGTVSQRAMTRQVGGG